MARYQPIRSDLYGNHTPYDRGTAVAIPDVEAGSGRHARDWNVSLVDPLGDSLLLWVHEIETSFKLEGKTAQSRSRRQFFPHNFAQPKMTVRGIVPNNYQYNRLASFVRRSQAWALGAEDLARVETMATMSPGHSGQPFTGRTRGKQAVPTTQLALKPNKSKIQPGRTHRGPHVAWLVEGYVKNIKAGATRFEYAKEFEFEFIITSSVKSGATGLYQDTAVNGSEIASWMDLFQKGNFQGIGPHSIDRAINTATRTAEEIASDLGNIF